MITRKTSFLDSPPINDDISTAAGPETRDESDFSDEDYNNLTGQRWDVLGGSDDEEAFNKAEDAHTSLNPLLISMWTLKCIISP